MAKRKNKKQLSFGPGMKPIYKEKERSRISPRPLSKTSKKITRYRSPKMPLLHPGISPSDH